MMHRAYLGGLALVLAGCSSFDPWGDLSEIPRAPSLSAVLRREAGRAPAPLTAPEGRLSLSQCVAIGLERNPRTKGAWENMRSAANRVGEERAAYLPSADFSAGASRSDTPDLRDKGPSPLPEYSAGFSLAYLLYDGGARYGRLRGAKAELAGTMFRHDAILQEVALEIELAYHERLAALSLIREAEAAVRRSETQVGLARGRLQSGVTAKFDVLKAETEKADADLVLVRARSASRIAEGRLNQAMGLRVAEVFEIEGAPAGARADRREDVKHLLDEALRKRPELQAAGADVEARRAAVRTAQSQHLPRVGSFAEYGWRDREFAPDREDWTVGVGITIPLFRGFETAYQVKRAEAELGRSRADREALARAVEFDVWTVYQRQIESEEAVEASRKLVASADESARVAEGRYRAGAGSIIEYTDALSAQTSARMRLVRAELEASTSVARLDRAVGRTASEKGDRR